MPGADQDRDELEQQLREHTRQMALSTGRDPEELWEELTQRQSVPMPQDNTQLRAAVEQLEAIRDGLILFRDRKHSVSEIRQLARDGDEAAIAELGMRDIPLTFANSEEAHAWIERTNARLPKLPMSFRPMVQVDDAERIEQEAEEAMRTFPVFGEPELRRRAGDQELPTIDPSGICVQDEVIAYIERRKAVGIERYGTVLQPHNGRDALRDLFDELTDGVNYCAQALIERDGALPGAGEGNRNTFAALVTLARDKSIGLTFEWFPNRPEKELDEFANVTLEDDNGEHGIACSSFTGTIAEVIAQACEALRQ